MAALLDVPSPPVPRLVGGDMHGPQEIYKMTGGTMIAIDVKIPRYYALKTQAEKIASELRTLTAEILADMQERGASRIDHPDFEVVEQIGKASYDVDLVRAKLGEYLSPDAFRELVPDQSTCRMCHGLGLEPPRVDGNAARKVRTMGAQVAALLDQCANRGPSTLLVTPKVKA